MMSFIELLRRIGSKSNSHSGLSAWQENKFFRLWEQKNEGITNRTFRVSSIIGFVCAIIWLTSLDRPIEPKDMLPPLVLVAAIFLSYVKLTYTIRSFAIYTILYIVAIILLGSPSTVTQATLYFTLCIFGFFRLMGFRWGIILIVITMLLLAMFSCGITATPFSTNCTAEFTTTTIIGNLAVFLLVVILEIFSMNAMLSDLEKGLVDQAELSAALTQKSEDLAHALAKEQEINQIRSNLINVVSHEFRTPITVINISSKILKHKYNKGDLTSADSENYHEKIDGSLGRLADLIDIVVANKPDTDDELNRLIEEVKRNSWVA